MEVVKTLYKVKNTSKASSSIPSSSHSTDLSEVLSLLHDIKAQNDDLAFQTNLQWDAINRLTHLSNQHFSALQNQTASVFYQNCLNHRILGTLLPVLDMDRDIARATTAKVMLGCISDACHKYPVRNFRETYLGVRELYRHYNPSANVKEKEQDAKIRIEELKLEAEARRRAESEAYYAAQAERFDVEEEITANVNERIARKEAREEFMKEARAKGKGKARGYNV